MSGLIGFGLSKDPESSFNAPNAVGDGAVTLNSDDAPLTLGAAQIACRVITLAGEAPQGFVFPEQPGRTWIVNNTCTSLSSPLTAPVSTKFGGLTLPPGVFDLWIDNAGLPRVSDKAGQSELYDLTSTRDKARKVTVARRFTSLDDDPIDIQVIGNVAPVLGVDAVALKHSNVFVRAHVIAERSDADECFSKAVTRAYKVSGAPALTALGALKEDTSCAFSTAGASGMDVTIDTAGTKIVVEFQPRIEEIWRWFVIIEASFVTNAE